MSYIFTRTKNTTKFQYASQKANRQVDPINLSEELIPGAYGGHINVVKDFAWTLTPKGSKALNETPYIKLKEYYLFDSYLNQLFNTYGIKVQSAEDLANVFTEFGAINTDTDTLYEGLYDLTSENETGFTYWMPFFSPTYLTTNNTWTSKPMFEEIVELQRQGASLLGAGAAAGATATITAIVALFAARVPGLAAAVVGKGLDLAGKFGVGASRAAGAAVTYSRLFEQLEIGLESPIATMTDPALDKPYIWNNTTPRTHQITFPLFNTLGNNDSNWNLQIIKNWELCHLLCYQNLYNKRNLFTGVPPVFYEITIPGVHYCKAGYVSNLNILNIGNTRSMSLPVGANGENVTVNVPDAYVVNMTVTDFFMPSKNFLDTVTSNDKGILVETINQASLRTPTTQQQQALRSAIESPELPASNGAGIPMGMNPFRALNTAVNEL